VAERALHDFFHNVRRLTGSMIRVRLFGLFLGVEETEKGMNAQSALQVQHTPAILVRPLSE
jgi:hypothetical protein